MVVEKRHIILINCTNPRRFWAWSQMGKQQTGLRLVVPSVPIVPEKPICTPVTSGLVVASPQRRFNHIPKTASSSFTAMERRGRVNSKFSRYFEGLTFRGLVGAGHVSEFTRTHRCRYDLMAYICPHVSETCFSCRIGAPYAFAS